MSTAQFNRQRGPPGPQSRGFPPFGPGGVNSAEAPTGAGTEFGGEEAGESAEGGEEEQVAKAGAEQAGRTGKAFRGGYFNVH